MPYIELLKCGAVGDGLHDDTAALALALGESARTGAPVYVPRGKYAVRPLRFPDGASLLGNASWGYSSRGYENNKIKDGRPTDTEFNGNAVFMPIIPDGQAPGGALFDMTGCRGARITGLSFEGMNRGSALDCFRVRDDGARSDVVFDDVRVCHFTGDGIRLENVTGFAIRRSLIIQNEGHAVRCVSASDGSVIDNQLSYNKGAGFYSDEGGAHGVTITGNRIEGGSPGGVYLCDSSFIAISGNSFDSCRGPAVALIGSEVCSAAGNMARISGYDRDGDDACHFRLENSRGLSVIGNSFWAWFKLIGKNSTRFGMVLRSLEDSVISGNAFFDACSGEVLRDYGGHSRCAIDGNVGSAFDISTLDK